jgi:hypothetical protein
MNLILIISITSTVRDTRSTQLNRISLDSEVMQGLIVAGQSEIKVLIDSPAVV